MEKEIENLDSLNEENAFDFENEEDSIVLKEEYKKIHEKNRHLFERAKKAEGELKTLKVEKPKEEKPEAKKEPVRPGDLDYAQLAYLAAKGIEDDDEIELVKEVVSETGKELKTAVTGNYFQARLKELRAIKTAHAAMPKSSTRFSPTSRDSTEYWIAKYDQTGELPPKDQVELRRKVVKARLQKEENSNKFAPISIIQ